MITGARGVHTLLDQSSKIDMDPFRFMGSGFAGLEDLIDGGHQTSRILEHEPVKLMTLGLIDLSTIERLQVKANRSNRGLQFVSDRIDETVVLLVSPDFANQKTGIEDQTGDDGAKEEDAQQNFDAFLPVDNDPAEADGNRGYREKGSQREKKGDLAPPGNAHGRILARGPKEYSSETLRPAERAEMSRNPSEGDGFLSANSAG